MFDEVQARKDADYELSARLTQEEQEKYTIKERAKLLAEFFERRKKQIAAERAKAIKNKPPTKTQLRSLMMTYLKNMEVVKDSGKKDDSSSKPAGGSRRKTLARKRTSEKQSKQSAKRQKLEHAAEEQESVDSDDEASTEYEQEKEELRLSLKIIPNIDSEEYYEPLSKKIPIVSWEYQLLGRMEEKDMEVYKLTRANGTSRYHGNIQAFLRRLDRQDLNDLYRLDPNENNEVWMNKLDWKVLRWKLHENCRVHTLFLDGTPMEINMLVEKKYHLFKELLEKMLNLQLEAEEESTMAFELIKFIKSLLEK
ncbi:hypothetical protein Tco_0523792 [Tanacetum coccineum]